MARKLTEPMKKVLRIMVEGHEIECGRSPWDSSSRYEPFKSPRPHRGTINGLWIRGMIEHVPSNHNLSTLLFTCYRLTEAGRRAEEEEQR